MHFAIETTSGPAVEPRSLAEAKAHLRVGASGENALITGLIVTARQVVENYTGRALIDQQRKLYLDRFPDWELYVPVAPLRSITSIAYVDTDGATQALAASGYLVDAKSPRGRVTPAYGTVWPTTREQVNAVTVTFRAGYASGVTSAVGDVPAQLKQAMDLLLGQYYEHREDVAAGAQAAPIPQGARWLMDPFVSQRFNGLE